MELVHILKALANERRLKIIQLLISHKELTVQQIAKELDLSFKATSSHLRALYRADVIACRRAGAFAFYALRLPIHRVVDAAIRSVMPSAYHKPHPRSSANS